MNTRRLPTLPILLLTAHVPKGGQSQRSREVARQLTAEFMQKKIGLRFAGVISGVTEFGVFVQLSDFPIDGLIHVSKLGPEYFLFDAPRSQLTGQTSGRAWRLGDVVRDCCRPGRFGEREDRFFALRSTMESPFSRWGNAISRTDLDGQEKIGGKPLADAAVTTLCGFHAIGVALSKNQVRELYFDRRRVDPKNADFA